MKHTLTLSALFIVLCCGTLRAQYRVGVQPPAYPVVYQAGAALSQVIDTMLANVNPADTGEGGAIDQLQLFQTFWQGRVLANDSSGHSMFDQYYKALRSTVLAGEASPCSGSGSFSGNWQCIGPDSMPVQDIGYLNAVWADTGSDSNYILAGSLYTGLFKTTDGGKNWACITDNTPLVGGVMGISQITVNPLNHNTIYLGTVNAGIMESFDGGNTWQQEFIGSGSYGDSIESIQKVLLTPDSTRLYAFKGDSVYTRSNAPVGAWVNITPPGIDPNSVWYDLQFVPGNQQHFFISNTVGATFSHAGVWASDTAVPASGNWNEITAGFTATLAGSFINDTSWLIMDMSIPDDTTCYFIAMSKYNSAALYKYNIATQAIDTILHLLPTAGNPNQLKFGLIVSQANPAIMYYATDVPYQSDDTGHTFNQIGSYTPFPATPTHADIRCMYLQQDTNTPHGTGNRLFIADDGGISKKPAGIDDAVSGENTTINISGHGLATGTFNGFATSEAGGVGIGGEMHDGITDYEPAQTTPWLNLGIADAYTTAINNAQPPVGYAFYGFGGIALSATAPGAGREMDASIYCPPPPDIIIGNTAIAIDNFGDVVCGTDRVSVKGASGGFSELEVSGVPIFPHANTGDHIVALAFSPYDTANSTNFSGYVFYSGAQQIYYRNPAIPAYASANPINVSTIPGVACCYPVACLCTDPHNTQRLWVGQGGINFNNYSSTQDRVQYSTDNGATWVDVSNGLPQRMPITNIIYDEAANTLYASTDAGIFKCDFSTYNSSATVSGVNTSVQWTCFNTGLVAGTQLPYAYVTGLQINHCQGKLYSATYGRSVWSTDLYAPGENPNPTDTFTSGATTWYTNQYVTGGIEIENGATLTITGDTIFMPKNGIISVEPGGHLICNNAVITNGCQSCFWQGIQLKGSTSLQPTAANDGWATINNSIIENAQVGISNYQGSGGIAQATGSSFIDCHNDVTLSNFIWLNSAGIIGVYPCYFYNCNFQLDSAYKGDQIDYPATYFVNLEDVSGVTFQGCNWLNRDPSTLEKGTGTGIYNVDGGFSVSAYCPGVSGVYSGCAAPTPSRFCGFTNAIMLSASAFMELGLTTGIDHTIFDSSGVGINISALNSVSATADTFNIGAGVPVNNIAGACTENIGIYTQEVNSFRIEANAFLGVSPSGVVPLGWKTMGAVIASTNIPGLILNDPVNTIYRNSFSTLTYGAYPLGANPRLNIACNAFSNNYADIFIGSDGAAPWQGIIACGSYTQPAANTFSGSTYNIFNGVSPIPTYFYSLPDSTGQVPNSASGVGLLSTSATDVCTPTFGITGGGGTHVFAPVRLDPPTLRAYQQAFLAAQQTEQDSLASLTALIDFGNTDSLIKYIDASKDKGELFKTLTIVAPYLSVRAAREATGTRMLSATQMVNVLQLNPDVLRDFNFDVYLDSIYAFSSCQANTLYAYAADSITARTITEDSITNANMETSYYATLIMLDLTAPGDTAVSVSDTTGAGICTDSTSIYYTLDSNAAYTAPDTIDTWLQHIGGLSAYYARAALYNQLQQYTIADSIMSNLPSRNDTVSAIWSVLYNAETNGRTIYTLDSADIAALDTTSAIQYGYISFGSVLTTNITNIINPGLDFNAILPIPCLHQLANGRNSNGSDNGLQSSANAMPFMAQAAAGQFATYPNPASGTVTFAYNVPDPGGDIRIIITNVLGQQQAELHTHNNTGTMQWNPAALAQGIYIYQATATPGIIATGKIILAR